VQRQGSFQDIKFLLPKDAVQETKSPEAVLVPTRLDSISLDPTFTEPFVAAVNEAFVEAIPGHKLLIT